LSEGFFLGWNVVVFSYKKKRKHYIAYTARYPHSDKKKDKYACVGNPGKMRASRHQDMK